MFTRMVGGNIGDGYVYKSDYYLMYDESGSSPAEATRTYTAQQECIIRLHLTLNKISSTFPYAYISINNVRLRSITTTTGVFDDIIHLNAGDSLTVKMRSYNTGQTANYINIYTQFTA